MPVVFDDPEVDAGPAPWPRRGPRRATVAAAVVVVGVVALVLTRGGDGRPTSAAVTASPPVVSLVPTAARGVVARPGGSAVVVVDQYGLPGVMSVAGRAGWTLDAAASSADVRRYTARDLATGILRPTVTFGVADRSPLAGPDAEARRYVDGLTRGGATGFTTVSTPYEDTVAVDLSYTTAGGVFVMERLWLHAGIAVFVRVSDVWAETVATVFDDTVRHGAVTP